MLLPAYSGDAAVAEGARRTTAELSGPRARILVIDDDELVAKTASRVLGHEHEVLTAGGGREAINVLLEDGDFDLVLCDLMMPEMNGMELHAEVQHRRPELSERFVFITGGASVPQAREFLASVPNMHVEKPFDFDNLRKIVRKEVSRLAA